MFFASNRGICVKGVCVLSKRIIIRVCTLSCDCHKATGEHQIDTCHVVVLDS